MQARVGDVIFVIIIVLCSVVGSVVNACIQSKRIANTCDHSWCSFVICANVPLMTYVQEMDTLNADVRTFSTQCGYKDVAQASSTVVVASNWSNPNGNIEALDKPFDIPNSASSDSSTSQPISSPTYNAESTSVTRSCIVGTTLAGAQRGSIIPDYTQSTCSIQYNTYDDECTRMISEDGEPIREIMDSTSTAMSRFACGKWVDAYAASTTIHSYTFNQDLTRRMQHQMNQLCIESTVNSADGSYTPLIYYQLHQTCDAYFALTVADRAEQLQLGLDSLMFRMGFSRQPNQPYVNENTLTGVNHLAKNVGLLTSFGCASFVDSNVDVEPEQTRLIPSIYDGELPSFSEMKTYNIDQMTISEFERFRTYRNQIDPFVTNYNDMCNLDTQTVITEFINGLTHASYAVDAFQSQRLAQLTPTLMAFACYSMQTGSFDRYKVSILLYGAAKVCIQRYNDHVENSLTIKDPLVFSLYRMKRDEANLFDAPSTLELRMASRIGISRLRSSNNELTANTISSDGSIDGCYNVMQQMLPSLTERALYDYMVSDTLVTKLATVIETVRGNIVQIFSDTQLPIRRMLTNADGTISLVRTVRIYFKGAEDNSMFGDNPSTVQLRFDGSRGFVNAVMNSVLERNVRLMNDAFSERNPCELPNMFELTSANAYYIRNANCIHVMLGLLQPPFAHESYDLTRLTQLFGFYIAHEIAHTAHTYGLRDSPETDVVLNSYSFRNLYDEGFADLVALMAVLMAMPDTSQDCEDAWVSFAQTFCSSSIIQPTTDDTHPFGNTRVDALWSTVKQHFPSKYTCNR
jgi:hypothetical protein